jgi:hypothetical protein
LLRYQWLYHALPRDLASLYQEDRLRMECLLPAISSDRDNRWRDRVRRIYDWLMATLGLLHAWDFRCALFRCTHDSPLRTVNLRIQMCMLSR